MLYCNPGMSGDFLWQRQQNRGLSLDWKLVRWTSTEIVSWFQLKIPKPGSAARISQQSEILLHMLDISAMSVATEQQLSGISFFAVSLVKAKPLQALMRQAGA
jgi:hypothetical protein